MPVIVDVCPSTTTNGMAARMARNGERMPRPVADRSRRQHDRRSGRADARAEGRDPAARRRRSRSQGICARADGRDDDRLARRLRARRRDRPLGRVGIPADHRSGEVRRRGGVPARKQRARAILPLREAAARARACACRASARWRAPAPIARGREPASATSRRCCEPWARKFGIAMPAAITSRGATDADPGRERRALSAGRRPDRAT